MGRLFGTDGVRGVANQDLSGELALRLGWAGAHVAAKGTKGSKIVVGRDTRASGDLLESALTAGILAAGCDVLKVGVMPTPGIAFLTRDFAAAAGVVISASHNPAEDNGIKFFGADGFKFSDADEYAVEKRTLGGKRVSGRQVGRMLAVEDESRGRYIAHALASIGDEDLGFRVAVDCANGAASFVAPSLLRSAAIDVTAINNSPDGMNVNAGCGSTHPQCISHFVKGNRFDIGLAFDGDADRVIAVDATGALVDGDTIMAICADHLKSAGRLSDATVVTTVMSNLGFYKAMEQRGIKTVTTDVGDRFVLEEMLKHGLNLGGEQSGHIIFLDYNPTGDGLITSLQLMHVMKRTGKTLAELKRIVKRFPQVLLNVPVAKNRKLARAGRVWQAVKAEEARLKGDGRILVRPSGTEPLVRVMVEAATDRQARQVARSIADVVSKELA